MKHTSIERSKDLRESLEQGWRPLDTQIRSWWDLDIASAAEADIRATPQGSEPLLFLPFPYVRPGGAQGAFAAMYCWDTFFINEALLAHGRLDLVRNHILNYLFMIERFGYMPNSNDRATQTRSQTPVLPISIWKYYLATGDDDLLHRAYPLLKREYEDYWNAPHHRTPTGLATNRDVGDEYLTAELAAEAETGLDWTPIFAGDVRRCVPLITNCALVRYARLIAMIGARLGRRGEAADFARQADTRASLIRKYCWSEETGFFHEYDYQAQRMLPYVSACAYWALWAGVATEDQAKRLARNLPSLVQRYGLASTDQEYADARPDSSYAPDPETSAEVPHHSGGGGNLQWMYPAGWAPEQIIAVEGLDSYGYGDQAEQVARAFLTVLVEQYHETGELWEKYNVLDGGLVVPNSRYGNLPMHGWSAAAAVILGRRLFTTGANDHP
ncbi:trehalase family glycosidase [Jiangella muralis]|uniref:trehalase family glycosidase n=1 Tax=Jiangella muralis TaxID=702383 RepID=UPI000AB5849B|nr:trehalase family glycosidase [Jiangella muralis]